MKNIINGGVLLPIEVSVETEIEEKWRGSFVSNSPRFSLLTAQFLNRSKKLHHPLLHPFLVSVFLSFPTPSFFSDSKLLFFTPQRAYDLKPLWHEFIGYFNFSKSLSRTPRFFCRFLLLLFFFFFDDESPKDLNIRIRKITVGYDFEIRGTQTLAENKQI